MILMTANIHILHTRAEPVSGFLRIGHTGHRDLQATEGSPSRSRPPAFRGGALSISAVLGR